MDFKDLLNKIDSLQEQTSYQSSTNHNPAGYDQPASFDYTKKYDQKKSTTPATDNQEQQVKQTVDKLNNIFKQLQLKAQIQESIDIYKTLVESFGYVINEEDGDWWERTKSGGKRLLSKLSLPITAGLAIWEGWEQIEELPPDLSKEERTRAVRTIVGNLIADYGVFWVGSIIGAAIAGVYTGPFAGPGAVVGGITGGFAAQYALGDNPEIIVEKIVEYTMEKYPPPEENSEEKPSVQDSPAVKQRPPDNELVSQLQYELNSGGFTGSDDKPLILNNQLNSDVIVALQKFMNARGENLVVNGQVSPEFSAAFIKRFNIRNEQ